MALARTYSASLRTEGLSLQGERLLCSVVELCRAVMAGRPPQEGLARALAEVPFASGWRAHQEMKDQSVQYWAWKSVTGRSRASTATERHAEGRVGTEAQGAVRDLHVALGTCAVGWDRRGGEPSACRRKGYQNTRRLPTSSPWLDSACS